MEYIPNGAGGIPGGSNATTMMPMMPRKNPQQNEPTPPRFFDVPMTAEITPQIRNPKIKNSNMVS